MMNGLVLCAGLLSAAFAQVGGDEWLRGSSREGFSHEEALKEVTEEGTTKVLRTLARIDGVSSECKKMAGERLECLKWEYNMQKEAVNRNIADAVSEGMQKKKQVGSFQCISKEAGETLQRLEAIGGQIPGRSEEMIRRGVAGLTSLRLVMPGFNEYVEVLYKKKSEEMKKADSDSVRKKILGEVMDKMYNLKMVLKEIGEQLKDVKFKFFEEFVKFASATDGRLKEIQREGAKKMQKCLA